MVCKEECRSCKIFFPVSVVRTSNSVVAGYGEFIVVDEFAVAVVGNPGVAVDPHIDVNFLQYVVFVYNINYLVREGVVFALDPVRNVFPR